MKYIQVKFTAEPDSQDVRDIIAALAAEVGLIPSQTNQTDSLATAKKIFSIFALITPIVVLCVGILIAMN